MPSSREAIAAFVQVLDDALKIHGSVEGPKLDIHAREAHAVGVKKLAERAGFSSWMTGAERCGFRVSRNHNNHPVVERGQAAAVSSPRVPASSPPTSAVVTPLAAQPGGGSAIENIDECVRAAFLSNDRAPSEGVTKAMVSAELIKRGYGKIKDVAKLVGTGWVKCVERLGYVTTVTDKRRWITFCERETRSQLWPPAAAGGQSGGPGSQAAVAKIVSTANATAAVDSSMASLRAFLEDIVPSDPEDCIPVSMVRKELKRELGLSFWGVDPNNPRPWNEIVRECGFLIRSKRDDSGVSRPAIRRRKRKAVGETITAGTASASTQNRPPSAMSSHATVPAVLATPPAVTKVELTEWRELPIGLGNLDATRSDHGPDPGHHRDQDRGIDSDDDDHHHAHDLLHHGDVDPGHGPDPFLAQGANSAAVARDNPAAPTFAMTGMYRPFLAGLGLDGHRRPLHARELLPPHMSCGYLGVAHPADDSSACEDAAGADQHVFLNTQDPFCAVACGVQGSGKSHSLGVLLETCLLSGAEAATDGAIRLAEPMTVLALHFDRSPHNNCEIVGLLQATQEGGVAQSRSKTLVLVSPDDYHRRRAFYGDICEVRPLLFSWRDLTAKDLLVLMRVDSGDTQLYMANMLNLLRGYQRRNVLPPFADFMAEVRTKCCSSGSQSGPLEQRLALLASIVAESEVNVGLRADGTDVRRAVADHNLVVADLTDPMRTGEEANGIFQVLLEQFRAARLPAGRGKALFVDEAHKFVSGKDGLTEAIVDCVRLMRHDGLRVIIGTQSPEVLSPELLELVTFVLLHKIQSRRWYKYLADKVPLPDVSVGFPIAMAQGPGYALLGTTAEIVVRATGRVVALSGARILVRPRLTKDRGSSRIHGSAPRAGGRAEPAVDQARRARPGLGVLPSSTSLFTDILFAALSKKTGKSGQ
jgi:hypothetical protein